MGEEYCVLLIEEMLVILELFKVFQLEYVFEGQQWYQFLFNMVMLMFLRCMGIEEVIVYGFCLMFWDWVSEYVNVLCEIVEMSFLY